MGRNSVLGADRAPLRPKGSGEDALGPGDSTDSGSDLIGADDRPAADPNEPVDLIVGRDTAYAPIEHEREDEEEEGQGADISVDQVFDTDGSTGVPDPGPIDGAMADDPLDAEPEADATPETPNRAIRNTEPGSRQR